MLQRGFSEGLFTGRVATPAARTNAVGKRRHVGAPDPTQLGEKGDRRALHRRPPGPHAGLASKTSATRNGVSMGRLSSCTFCGIPLSYTLKSSRLNGGTSPQ